MRKHRLLLIALLAFAVVAQAAPAAAHPAVGGSLHEFGEMVQYPLVFPVAGENHYSDTFWASRGSYLHHAQDIMADKMTPVVAVADGTVDYVNWGGSSCCTLQIDHDDGWTSVYIHLNNDTPGTDDGQGWGIADGITAGTRVTAGQLIGWVGDSGNAEGTAPHLHFELKDPEGVYVNPYEALLAAEQGIVLQSGSACLVTRPKHAADLLAMTTPLRRGDRGTEVEQLQEFLATFGYPVGSIDGSFGSKTENALVRFQEDLGLVSDGIAGSGTRAAIGDLLQAALHRKPLLPDAGILEKGMKGPQIRHLKHLLVAAGFDPGVINGKFNNATRRAVRQFQRSVDIDVDGVVGSQTRTALAAALGITPILSCD